MKIRGAWFNIYFLLVILATGGASGCKTTEEKTKGKEASTFRLYLEDPRDMNDHGSGVPIYRQSPIYLNIAREPFLNEGDLDSASVIDMPGGYAIKVQFNGHGALVLEGVTVAHKGQHLAIKSVFGETRWLAAPLIKRRISNGELIFTPDATREEAERVVRGLTNLIVKLKKKSSGF